MITARIEDYLEELFLLESTGRTITVTDLAERLKITKGTVTVTIQKLVELGLVEHERYGALRLTPEGRSKGLMVFRRHEGLRAFFHEMLGLDREHASEMACSMEHYVDAVTEERLYALLEHFRHARAEHQPWVDDAFAAIEKPILLPRPLTLCSPGDRGTILRLTADAMTSDGAPLRKELTDRGLSSGASFALLGIEGMVWTVKVKRHTVELSLNEAATVWVQTR